MPYSTKEKLIAYYKSDKVKKRQREYMAKKRKEDPVFAGKQREIARKYSKSGAQYKKIKADKRKYDRLKRWMREHRRKNKDKINAYHRKKYSELGDTVVAKDFARRAGVKRAVIYSQPELIKAHRLYLQIKQLINNGNKN